MKKFVKQYLLIITGLLAGALGGYFYWKFIGCASGTCAITSNPLNSTLYGLFMGGLLGGIFQKDNKKTV